MVKLKKLKIIKRIPKIPKFKQYDELKTLKAQSNYLKVLYIFLITLSFFFVNSFVIQPVIKEGNLIQADYDTKKTFINSNKDLKQNLLNKIGNAQLRLEELNPIFFNNGEQDQFYKAFSEIALDNKLKITAIDKLAEEFYSEDPGDGNEIQFYEQFTQIQYSVSVMGNFIDYINFIDELKSINKSLFVNYTQITKDENGIVNIESQIIVNFKNS